MKSPDSPYVVYFQRVSPEFKIMRKKLNQSRQWDYLQDNRSGLVNLAVMHGFHVMRPFAAHMTKDLGVQTQVFKEYSLSYSGVDWRHRHSWEYAKWKLTLWKRTQTSKRLRRKWERLRRGGGLWTSSSRVFNRTMAANAQRLGNLLRLVPSQGYQQQWGDRTHYACPGPTRLMTTPCPMATQLVRRHWSPLWPSLIYALLNSWPCLAVSCQFGESDF